MMRPTHEPGPTEPGRPSRGPGADLAQDRTGLAAFRTQLALDRTTLTWARTTLAMASFGFGMVAFFRTLRERTASPETIRLLDGAIRMGTALILVGIASMVLAGISHWLAPRRLRRGESPALGRWPLSITLTMLIAIIGLDGLWSLFVRK